MYSSRFLFGIFWSQWHICLAAITFLSSKSQVETLQILIWLKEILPCNFTGSGLLKVYYNALKNKKKIGKNTFRKKKYFKTTLFLLHCIQNYLVCHESNPHSQNVSWENKWSSSRLTVTKRNCWRKQLRNPQHPLI